MCDESSFFTESKIDVNQVFDLVKQTRVAVAYVEQHRTRISIWRFCMVTSALLVVRGQTASKVR